MQLHVIQLRASWYFYFNTYRQYLIPVGTYYKYLQYFRSENIIGFTNTYFQYLTK